MQRAHALQQLNAECFDILIIGGGASGAGCALEAASRGLSCAIIEANDFASGTSSKSSKLIHGGVRYLELAMKQRDPQQLALVKDALHERKILHKIAPHLVHELRLITPCKNKLEAGYYWAGLQAYDILAGQYRLSPTHWIPSQTAHSQFNELTLQAQSTLIAYSDGQFDDARMAISIIRTAEDYGACPVNYLRAENFIRETGDIVGIQAHDAISDTTLDIRARCIINACGPQSDLLRKKAMPDCQNIMRVSLGAHIVVSREFWPHDEGILIPKTDDGRVLFLIPWHKHIIIGTTDEEAEVCEFPLSKRSHIEHIIQQANKHLRKKIHSSDILSSWCGLRPLVQQQGRNSAQLVRDHFIAREEHNLISLTGGKWTTYRLMARDCINRIIKELAFTAAESTSHHIGLRGGKDFSQLSAQDLMHNHDISQESADQLFAHYGSEAVNVLTASDNHQLISGKHHYLHCEIDWAVQEEYAQRIADILSRRLRLSYIDIASAQKSIPMIGQRMAQLLNWSEEHCANEIAFTKNKLAQLFSGPY